MRGEASVGDYRKLLVWQRATGLARRVRALVDALPPRERRNIGDQLLRASGSIRFNIAEGAGLNSDAGFARHLRIAPGSANEVQDQLADLEAVGLLAESDRELPKEVAEIRAMLAVLHRRVSADAATSNSPRAHTERPPSKFLR